MLFLLGAGFNIDANHEAGPIINSYYVNKIDCGYPLVTAVLKLCFELEKTPEGKSIEDLLSQALQARDFKPMETLVDTNERTNSVRCFASSRRTGEKNLE